MDDFIRSAREIAMEKVEELGEPTEDERLSWKYSPAGEAVAGKYLKDDVNLLGELSRYPENGRPYVVRSAAEVLISNIALPKNEAAKKKNKKIMDGLKVLKSDKVAVENVYSRIRYLFGHYEEQGEQQRQQAYKSLKADMEARLQKAIQQQMGSGTIIGGGKVNVETQPQFQQEWRKLQEQLDSAYMVHLNEYKQALSETR
jgi:hypothetical protein